ncbi:MAG: hypothetical protein AAF191_03765 [Verrucomicrobiota bacterium]
MKTTLSLLLTPFVLVGSSWAEGPPPPPMEPVTEDDFRVLQEHSPFSRSVDLSGTLGLTGVAWIEGEWVATLVDLKTKKTLLVSKSENKFGWELVDVRGDIDQLNSLTAELRVAGEVISVAYHKTTFDPTSRLGRGGPPLSNREQDEARRSARDFKRGFSADGFRDKPPKEVAEKLARMSIQQRENLNRYMLQLRNKGLESEERRKIYVNQVDRIVGSR